MITPDFFDSFRCKAQLCKDSCCIGWRVDIDSGTQSVYEQLGGAVGETIRSKLRYDGDSAYIPAGRCPFLLESGLCRIIDSLGEDALCDVCYEHPRFYNENTGGDTEAGLGLCCEKVCETLFDKDYRLKFTHGRRSAAQKDRDEYLRLLTGGDIGLSQAVSLCIERASLRTRCRDVEIIKKTLDCAVKSEPYSDIWSEKLNGIVSSGESLFNAIDRFEPDREFFAKVISYTFFRHSFNDELSLSMPMRFGFSLLFSLLVYLGELALFCKNGSISCGDRLISIALFSKQFEYSAENLKLLEDLCGEIFVT